MTIVVRKKQNRNYGLDTIHRSVVGRLDKVGPKTLLCVRVFKEKDGSWAKYLTVKNTNEKIMLLTALIKGPKKAK